MEGTLTATVTFHRYYAFYQRGSLECPNGIPAFPFQSPEFAPLIASLHPVTKAEDLLMKSYTAIVERCQETGLYVGSIPGFPGAHTQGETLDELNRNLREVVEMLLEDGEPKLEAEFVGTQNVVVA